VCAWNVSEEDGFSCQQIEGGYRLRLWYQENQLVSGAYECNFALRDASSYETIDRVASVASFFITKPGRARGIVMMSPRWELCKSTTGCGVNDRNVPALTSRCDDEMSHRENPAA
jgi:hypothetical protein